MSYEVSDYITERIKEEIRIRFSKEVSVFQSIRKCSEDRKNNTTTWRVHCCTTTDRIRSRIFYIVLKNRPEKLSEGFIDEREILFK